MDSPCFQSLLYIHCCSVAQSCLTLCNPMDCSLPAFLVLHCLLEFVQTHVHWVSDAIQPPHSLSSASPPAFNLFQHQGLLNELALDISWPEYWSFSFSISPHNIQGWFPLGLMGLIFMLSKGLSRVFSSTTVRKYQLLGAQTSLWYNYHIHTWLLEKTKHNKIKQNIALTRWAFVNKVMSLIFEYVV